MRLVVSDSANDLIQERGGHLYVWIRNARCCGAIRTLATAGEAPNGLGDFRQVPGCDRFDLFMPTRLAQLPEELHIELRRFPRRVEAYWNGCAWVS